MGFIKEFRCLNCGHTWKARGNNPTSPQCPQCRKRSVIDNNIFDKAVTDFVRLLRNIGKADPLEELNRAYYCADEIASSNVRDPILVGKAISEIVKEALDRLGLPKPSKLPHLQ
jgi:hypothetical protein